MYDAMAYLRHLVSQYDVMNDENFTSIRRNSKKRSGRIHFVYELFCLPKDLDNSAYP